MQKNFYISLAIAAMALTSCQKAGSGDNDAPQAPGHRIDFSSYINRPTTNKAVSQDLTTFKASGTFKAWAYITRDGDGFDAPIASATAIVPHKTLVGDKDFGWSTTESLWRNAGNTPHYWPDLGLGKVSFFAVSGKHVTAFTAPTVGTGAKPASFTYTLGGITNTDGAVEDLQEDLLAAHDYDKVYDAAATNPGQVNFDFKHLLTQVRFSVAAADQSFRIKVLDIEIVDAINQGTFSFDPTAATTAAIGSWSIDAGATKANYSYFNAQTGGGQAAAFPTGFPTDGTDMTKHFVTDTKVDLPLFGGTDAKARLMMLPSVAVDAGNGNAAIGLKGVKLKVTYQCYILNGTGDGSVLDHWEKDGTQITRTIEFTESEKWEMNKQICYNLILFNSESGKIIYDPTVSTWVDEGSDSQLKPEEEI